MSVAETYDEKSRGLPLQAFYSTPVKSAKEDEVLRGADVSFYQQWRLFCDKSSMHGLSWVVEDKIGRVGNLIWFFVSLGFFTSLVIFTYFTLLPYVENNNFSTLVINKPFEDGIEYPSILICDPAPWNITRAAEEGIGIDQLSYVSYLLYPEPSVVPLDDETTIQLEEEYKTLLAKFNNYSLEMMDTLTYSCEDMLQYCRFGFEELSGKECCKTYFTERFYLPGSKCYRTTKEYTASRVGIRDGVEVSLHVSSTGGNVLNSKIARRPAFEAFGAIFGVFERNTSPWDAKTTNLGIDTFNKAVLTKSVLDETEKNGILSSITTNKYFCYPKNAQISYGDCMNNFYTKFFPYIFGNCSLIVHNTQKKDETSCTPAEIVSSSKRVLAHISSMATNITSHNCHDNCNTTTFESSLNSIVLDDGYKNRTFDLGNKIAYIRLSMFFDHSYYSLTKNVGKELSELLSDVGGNMGVWMGASMVTLIELACVSVVLLCKFFNRR